MLTQSGRAPKSSSRSIKDPGQLIKFLIPLLITVYRGLARRRGYFKYFLFQVFSIGVKVEVMKWSWGELFLSGMQFVEAFRQFQFKVGRDNFCLVHVSLVVETSSGQQKTKPTQQVWILYVMKSLIKCHAGISKGRSHFLKMQTSMSINHDI